MAHQTTHLPGRSSRYPWSKWMNGKAWTAKQGTDFDMTASAFRCYVGLVARRKGVKVETRLHGSSVSFQFKKGK